MKHKTLISILMSLAIFMSLTSCISPIPNDRAIFNLNGNVRELTISSGDQGDMTVLFNKSGFFIKDSCNFPLATFESFGEYRHAVYTYKEEGANCNISFEFDSKGRLETFSQHDEFTASEIIEKYKYKGDDRNPYYLTRITSTANQDKITEEGEILYSGLDEHGNWLESTWNGEKETRIITYYEGLQETPNCPVDKKLDVHLIKQIIFTILLLCVLFAWGGHMIWHIYFKETVPGNFSVEAFKAKRKEENRPEEATPEENTQADSYMAEAFNLWTVTGKDDQGETYLPLSIKAIKSTSEAIKKAMDLAPTDPDIVTSMNKIAEITDDMMKRKFKGSKTYVILTLVVSLLFWIFGDVMGYFFLNVLLSAIYILSCMKPKFMIIRLEMKGPTYKHSFMTRVFGGLAGMVASATTYKTITTWSDGSKTTSTDDSETWIAMVISFIIMMLLIYIMIVIAFINYLRNYIIYK